MAQCRKGKALSPAGKTPSVICIYANRVTLQKFREWERLVGLENSVSVGEKQAGVSFAPHLLSIWKPIHIKAAITVSSEKKEKKKRLNRGVCAVYFSLNVAFISPFYCLADGESLFAQSIHSVSNHSLCASQVELHEIPSSNIPRKCKSSSITVIFLLAQVFFGGLKAAYKVPCSITKFHDSDVWAGS